MPNPIPIRPDFGDDDPMFRTPLRADVCSECWKMFETRVPKWTERVLCPACAASFLMEMEEFANECEGRRDD